MSAGRIQIHEWSLRALGVGVTLSLVGRAGMCIETVSSFAVILAYAIALLWTPQASRMRLVANYGIVWAGYPGSSPVIEALHLPLHSGDLLNADRWLLGETPSIAMSAFHQRWIGELLSLGYLSYQAYLHWGLIDAGFKAPAYRVKMSRWVFTAFALGFAGYYLFPAASPYLAHAGLYDEAIAGGWLTRFNETLNASMGARYDAFPSLHALITLTLLAFDWRANRSRFWIMLVPSLLMAVGTLALRLHYCVDLVASVALFAGLIFFWRWHGEGVPER